MRGTDSPSPFPLAEFHAPEIIFGPGALAELGHCAARLGARRPFLVTDPGLIETGWVDEALAYVRQRGLRPVVWHGITPNPKDNEIEAAFERYAESGGDVIIGLGGGSCIDAASWPTGCGPPRARGFWRSPCGELSSSESRLPADVHEQLAVLRDRPWEVESGDSGQGWVRVSAPPGRAVDAAWTGEALFNAAAHGKATRALVRLRYRDNMVALSVSDNGTGDPAH